MIAFLLKLFGGGILDRILKTVDNAGLNETEREKARLMAVEAAISAQQQTWTGPGFWLAFLFVAPLALWWGAVCLYSVFWCARCAYPQPWVIAALPAPLDQWAGWIMMSIFVSGGAISTAKILKR